MGRKIGYIIVDNIIVSCRCTTFTSARATAATTTTADGSNPAIRYDSRADRRSWQAMLDLFAEAF